MKLIIKIGTAAIFDFGRQKIKEEIIEGIAEDIKKLVKDKNEVIIVTSGAVGCGKEIVGNNSGLGNRQACAAVGQIKLMEKFSRIFSKHNLNVAQFLINPEDLTNPQRISNITQTYKNLNRKIIPIVNENDVTSTEELSIGDNDTLAARFVINMGFDTLIILTEIGALIKDNKIIPESNLFETGDYDKMSISQKGFGGLKTKLEAAKEITSKGKTCIIAKAGDSVMDILNNKKPSTRFFL